MNSLELLQKLVKINSVFPNEQKISLFLQETSKKIATTAIEIDFVYIKVFYRI
jgi:hypothetical protein